MLSATLKVCLAPVQVTLRAWLILDSQARQCAAKSYLENWRICLTLTRFLEEEHPVTESVRKPNRTAFRHKSWYCSGHDKGQG